MKNVVYLCCFSVALSFVNLNVGLGQCYHRWQNIRDMKVLHFIPLSGGFLQYMNAIRAFVWFSIVHHIGHQIVSCILVVFTIFLSENVTKVYIPVKEIKKEMLLMQLDNNETTWFTYLMGKLTIVGFFSKKKWFFVKRLMYKIINDGNFVISKRLMKLSLYVLHSFSLIPLNFANSWYKLT